MILVDTNVIVAYHNTRDSCHLKAQALLKKIESGEYGPKFITDYVFDEAVTVCFLRAGKENAVDLGDNLAQSFHMIKISEQLFCSAWNLFKQSHKLSFTDCTNISAVKELSIDFIATFDEEFKKIKGVRIVDN